MSALLNPLSFLAGAGNYAQAIEAYESAIKEGKTDATVYCQLGTACLGLFRRTRQMELIERALAAFEKAAEENVEMRVNAAAAIHNVLSDTDRAVRLLNRVLAEKPDSTVAKVNLTNFTPDHATAIKTLIDLDQQDLNSIDTQKAATRFGGIPPRGTARRFRTILAICPKERSVPFSAPLA